MVNSPTIFDERRHFSEARLEQFREAVAEALSGLALDDLTIFCAGSYGRLEAGEHSDIDLFFVYKPATDTVRPTKSPDESRMFERIVAIAEGMGFPAFDRAGEFLKTQHASDVLQHLGSPRDDFENYFTARMLMLLESQPIFNTEVYELVGKSYIASYLRDYPNHADKFHFTMLYNDIQRYWRTLAANYEHKRNKRALGEIDVGREVKAKVKNFKLKFSRLTTCYSLIARLGVQASDFSDRGQDDQIAEVWTLAQLTPLERLAGIVSIAPAATTSIEQIFSEYAWFMGLTALTTGELEAKFATPEERQALFERADAYSEAVFEMLQNADTHILEPRQRLIRYLTV